MRSRRVLVTGGAGFIGASVVRGLLRQGAAVAVLDDLSSASSAYLDELDVDLFRGDILDDDVAASALDRCEGIIHLAAQTSVAESVANPKSVFLVNVAGTLAMLDRAREHGIERFVFASSNAALGPHEPPLDEELAPRPASPYGASKLAAEAYCLAFERAYRLPTICLRFANAYGPFSGHKTSVVTKFVAQLLNHEPITIYGDGAQTRDFIHVNDVARAVLLALNASTSGEILHIGTGRETSVLELVELLSGIVGVRPEVRWLPQPPGEIRRNYSAIGKAQRLLGFAAAITLEDGLRETVDWLRNHQLPSRRH